MLNSEFKVKGGPTEFYSGNGLDWCLEMFRFTRTTFKINVMSMCYVLGKVLPRPNTQNIHQNHSEYSTKEVTMVGSKGWVRKLPLCIGSLPVLSGQIFSKEPSFPSSRHEQGQMRFCDFPSRPFMDPFQRDRRGDPISVRDQNIEHNTVAVGRHFSSACR